MNPVKYIFSMQKLKRHNEFSEVCYRILSFTQMATLIREILQSAELRVKVERQLSSHEKK